MENYEVVCNDCDMILSSPNLPPKAREEDRYKIAKEVLEDWLNRKETVYEAHGTWLDRMVSG